MTMVDEFWSLLRQVFLNFFYRFRTRPAIKSQSRRWPFIALRALLDLDSITNGDEKIHGITIVCLVGLSNAKQLHKVDERQKPQPVVYSFCKFFSTMFSVKAATNTMAATMACVERAALQNHKYPNSIVATLLAQCIFNKVSMVVVVCRCRFCRCQFFFFTAS